MSQVITFIASPDNLTQTAKEVVNQLSGVKVIGFQGPLGAGKTTLIKHLCKVWGVRDEISSPTYSIVNEYRTSSDDVIYHMDLYRLETMEECLDIGMEDYLYSENICLIEWPEVAASLYPLPFGKINIEILDKSARRINLQIHR